jgi:hypothetical protein
MMMWNTVLADELVSNGCPWPQVTGYDDLAGGAEDPSIAAPFIARKYQELLDAASAARFATCSFNQMPTSDRRGFVYGFRIAFGSAACATGVLTTVEMGEYATRATRDRAAHDMSAGSLVLGRWAIKVLPADPRASAAIREIFVALGASEIRA